MPSNNWKSTRVPQSFTRCVLLTWNTQPLNCFSNSSLLFSGVTKKDVGPKGPTEEEIEASLNAAEEKRRERFENMEEERESMRQVIRDKVSYDFGFYVWMIKFK
ncbi:hypothetical protein FGIG_07861 [Fasciola gigantica]|uniref:Complexin n=1 Tax=Fasciola gigantica TaxID=46835 RepID=A0A504YEM9_FASGI|nr:hypothetical protein FGIG_07861 [Fasciola gigantica]